MEQLKTKMNNNVMFFCKKDGVTGYLGIHIDRQKNSTIHSTQGNLAQRIIEALHLTDSTIDLVDSPCFIYLPINEDSPPVHVKLNYPSIVGQLNYL